MSLDWLDKHLSNERQKELEKENRYDLYAKLFSGLVRRIEEIEEKYNTGNHRGDTLSHEVGQTDNPYCLVVTHSPSSKAISLGVGVVSGDIWTMPGNKLHPHRDYRVRLLEVLTTTQYRLILQSPPVLADGTPHVTVRSPHSKEMSFDGFIAEVMGQFLAECGE